MALKLGIYMSARRMLLESDLQVRRSRAEIEKDNDYRVALHDGYKIPGFV